jgi:predicted GNAT family acetyltransferase
VGPVTDHDRQVRDNTEQSRYELHVDGELTGFARYVRRGGRAYFVHTEINPAHEGEGLGSALARGALDAQRGLGEPVVPLCPFIRSYIERHPDFADVVDAEMLAKVDGE